MVKRGARTRPIDLKARERHEFALALRRGGARYRQIAQAVPANFGPDNVPKGYDERYAYHDVTAALAAHRARSAEDADAVRDLELERLDDMLSRLWPLVQRPADSGGPELRAVDRVLGIMQHRARLVPEVLAPTRVEHEGQVGLDVDIRRLGVDDLDELERILRKALAPAGEEDAGGGPAGGGDGAGPKTPGSLHAGDVP